MTPTKNEQLALALAKASCENERALALRLQLLERELDCVVELLEQGNAQGAMHRVRSALAVTRRDLFRYGRPTG